MDISRSIGIHGDSKMLILMTLNVGAAQADVAVLVVNATNGEFETGFDAGGQTREHTMLARSLGMLTVILSASLSR